MRAISDSLGARFLSGSPVGRVGSLPADEQSGRDGTRRATGAGEVGRFGALGRLWESRGGQWAEAVRIRQTDRRLSRLAERISDTRFKLEQYKLYPPYPVDEPRRAQAIRQFNGIAEEVRRLAGHQTDQAPLAPLADQASTSDAEAAVAALGRVGTQVAADRAALVGTGVPAGDVDRAETDSRQAAKSLGEEGVMLSRRSSDVLRQIG